MPAGEPQGVQVVSFKQPSSEELDHDFLWRTSKALPERGRVGIFNRLHYEEVVALRVHPEWLKKQKLPPGPRGPNFWAGRHEDINASERHLDRSRAKIVKIFLHVSKREQKRRFLARLDEPGKQWKFSAADLAERAHWDDYMRAFEEAITATSTPWAPWGEAPSGQSVMACKRREHDRAWRCARAVYRLRRRATWVARAAHPGRAASAPALAVLRPAA